MKDVICLCPSPCIDKYIYTESLTVGKEQKVKSASYVGGKGLNVACALASYDAKSTLVLLFPESDFFEKELKKRALPYTAVRIDAPMRENVTIIEQSGRETRLSQKCEAVSKAVAEEYARAVDGFDGIFILSGSIPDGIKGELLPVLSKKAELIIDSSSITKEEISALSPLLIKPNQEEAERDTGIFPTDKHSALEAAKIYASWGVQNVLISLGSVGMGLLCKDGRFFFADALKITPVSTVGAGDSSVAGFAYAYAGGMSMDKALAHALAFSAAACLTKGTDMLAKSDISRLLSSAKVTEVC